MAVFYDHFDGSLMIRLPSGGTGGGQTSEFRGLATEAQKNQYSGEYAVYLSFKRQINPGILLTEEAIADLETRRGVVAGEVRAALRESSTAVAHPDAGDPIRGQRDRDAAQRQANLTGAQVDATNRDRSGQAQSTVPGGSHPFDQRDGTNPDRRTQAERDAAARGVGLSQPETAAERDAAAQRAAPNPNPTTTTLPLTPAPSTPGTAQPGGPTSPPGTSTPFHPPSSPGAAPGIMTPRGDGHTG